MQAVKSKKVVMRKIKRNMVNSIGFRFIRGEIYFWMPLLALIQSRYGNSSPYFFMADSSAELKPAALLSVTSL